MSQLDNIIKIQQLDQSDLHQKITHLPEQIYLSYFQTEMIKKKLFFTVNFTLIDKVVICGMGGSAISADIAQTIFGKNFPMICVKDYKIPFIDVNTLCIFISYSGNTEETISCLQRVKALTPFKAVITTGGKIVDELQSDDVRVIVPPDLPPRAAIGHLFFSLLKVLETFKIIGNHAEFVNETVVSLMQKTSILNYYTPTEKNIAKSSAERILGKIPLIYSSYPLIAPVAYRWKCQINENAKYPAFFHTFPEQNHNELEAFTHKFSKELMIPIFLRTFHEETYYQRRIEIYQKMLVQQGVAFLEFYGEGNNDLTNVFNLIFLGDMISFYLAILNNVDPSTISNIELFKNTLPPLEKFTSV